MAKPWMTAKLLRGRKVGFEKANAGFGRGYTYTVEPWERGCTTPVPYDAPRYKRPKKRVRKPVRFLPDLTHIDGNPSIKPKPLE